MRIVVVEDDYLQAESLQRVLRVRWPDADTERIATESDFRNRVHHWQIHPPNLFFIDAMLRWQNPRPELAELPPDVASGGARRAGLRCVRLLQSRAETRDIPVIIYTVLDQRDLTADLAGFPPTVFFLQKTSDAHRIVEYAGSVLATTMTEPSSGLEACDLFICHASEDRLQVVDPIIEACEHAGVTVWHDRGEIRWGDSLVAKIQDGLKRSRYVLAILSRHSLAKRWPLTELNAALSGEISEGVVKVLPLIVGTEAEKSAILAQLPFQRDKLYEVWTGTVEPIVRRIKDRLGRPD
jgi:CheY-like chemotaxis protein